MRCCCLSQKWVLCTLGLFISLALGRAAALPEPATAPLEPDLDPADFQELLPRWDWSVTLQVAGGYDDNVGLSCCDPDGSPFVRSTIEAVALRLPIDDGNQITLLITAEDSRIFSSEIVDHEDLVVAQAEFRRFWENDWEASMSLEGSYLDQVVDLSVTENIPEPLPVRAAVLTGRPGAKRNLSETIWLSLELPISRQYYDETVDDYWELGPKITLGQTYGHESEIAAVYQFAHLDYDTEPALAVQSVGGIIIVSEIPDETRATSQHDVGVVWKHHWDTTRRWRSATRLSFRRSTDNAGGYYDYDRFQVSHQVRFKTKAWEASVEARVGFYDFPVQTISETSTTNRERTDLLIALRVERKLGRHIRLFAQYDHESTESNRGQFDEYAANTVSGGMGWEF